MLVLREGVSGEIGVDAAHVLLGVEMSDGSCAGAAHSSLLENIPDGISAGAAHSSVRLAAPGVYVSWVHGGVAGVVMFTAGGRRLLKRSRRRRRSCCSCRSRFWRGDVVGGVEGVWDEVGVRGGCRGEEGSLLPLGGALGVVWFGGGGRFSLRLTNRFLLLRRSCLICSSRLWRGDVVGFGVVVGVGMGV